MKRNLFDGVRLAGSARLIALNIVTRDKDAVAGNNFTRFKESDVTNYYLLLNEQYLVLHDKMKIEQIHDTLTSTTFSTPSRMTLTPRSSFFSFKT